MTGPTLTFLREQFLSLQVTDCTDVGGVLVDIDYPWSGDVRPVQNFSEKPLCCPSAAGLIQEKTKCLTCRVNSPVEIHTLATDFDIRLIDSPGIAGLLQIRAAAFIFIPVSYCCAMFPPYTFGTRFCSLMGGRTYPISSSLRDGSSSRSGVKSL